MQRARRFGAKHARLLCCSQDGTLAGQGQALQMACSWPAQKHPKSRRACAAPAEGLASFRKATIDLLLGADSPAVKEGRVACLQVRAAPRALWLHMLHMGMRKCFCVLAWSIFGGFVDCAATRCPAIVRFHHAQTVPAAPSQSLSGTGSLRIGAAFIAKFMPGALAYISRPTWGEIGEKGG